MTVLADFKKYISDQENATPYKTWAKQNPGEVQKWFAFRDAILAGNRPSPPTMATYQGKALVDAGMEYLDSLAPAPPPVPISGRAAVVSSTSATITKKSSSPVCVTLPKLTGLTTVKSNLTVTPGVWK